MRIPIEYKDKSDEWYKGYLLGFSTDEGDAVALIENKKGFVCMHPIYVYVDGQYKPRIQVLSMSDLYGDLQTT
jgi:hypothetical protein